MAGSRRPPFSLSLAGPAAAASKPLTTKNNKIIPFQSIGGVKLGKTKKQAAKAWHGTSKCTVFQKLILDHYWSCGWIGTSAQGRAQYFLSKKGHVTDVVIQRYGGAECKLEYCPDSPGRWSNPVPPAPLDAFQTSKAIKLGSTFADVKAVYPGGKALGLDHYEFIGDGFKKRPFFDYVITKKLKKGGRRVIRFMLMANVYPAAMGQEDADPNHTKVATIEVAMGTKKVKGK